MAELRINHLPYKMAVLLGVIEAVALLFVGLFNLDMKVQGSLVAKFLGGFFTGFFTLLIILLLLNAVLSKLNIPYGNRKVRKIGILVPAVLNGVFLAVLFTLESAISGIKEMHILGGNAIASLSTPVSLLFVLLVYNLIESNKLKIRFLAGNSEEIVRKFNALPIALVAALYEVLFLPSFAFFSQFSASRLVAHPLIALVAGFLSCLIVILIVNSISKRGIAVLAIEKKRN